MNKTWSFAQRPENLLEEIRCIRGGYCKEWSKDQEQRALDLEARDPVSIDASLLTFCVMVGQNPLTLCDDRLSDLCFVIMQTTEMIPPGTMILWEQFCP